MARNTIMTLALIAGVAATGGIALAQTAPTPTPPQAGQGTGPMGAGPMGQGGPGGNGDAPGMERMEQRGEWMEQHEERMEGRKERRDDDRRGRRGHDGDRRDGPGGAFMLRGFDTDGDGFVTQAEAQAGLTAQVAQHDADGDGALSLEEFSAMQAAMMREMFAVQFQRLDTSSDGKLDTTETGRIVDRITAEGPVRVPQAKAPAGNAAPAAPAATPAPADAAAPAVPQTPAATGAPAATVTPTPAN